MTTQSLPSTVRQLRFGVLLCIYSLIGLFLANSLTMTTQVSITTVILWVIQSFPLLIFLPALHKTHSRAYAWLSFVVLLYFVHGVLTAFTPQRFWFGVIESLLCTILFTVLILFIRQYRTSVSATL
jgi:uncharacterized membrane protein